MRSVLLMNANLQRCSRGRPFVPLLAPEHPVAGARRLDRRPCEPSGWACLQAIDLSRSGPGARTTLIAGVLPWRGDKPPTRQAVSGLVASDQGLVPIEVFTDGGLQVVDEGGRRRHRAAVDLPRLWRRDPSQALGLANAGGDTRMRIIVDNPATAIDGTVIEGYVYLEGKYTNDHS